MDTPSKETDNGYSFALAEHPGHLHFVAPTFKPVEVSAKTNGLEFGWRGQTSAGDQHLLAFLFALPAEAPLTSDKCRDAMLRAEKVTDAQRSLSTGTTGSTGPLALAQYTQTTKSGSVHHVRAFAASGDLCADIDFTSQKTLSADMSDIDKALASVQFAPNQPLEFADVYLYATVLFNHHAPRAAGPVYERSLTLLKSAPKTESEMTWRRAATDQAVMSYGMSGDLAHSRLLASKAVATDPGYPLNYYNLACADAEEGKAHDATLHLQQAFGHRADAIPGEGLPDPTKDDSLQKLKGDKEFWALAEKIHHELAKN